MEEDAQTTSALLETSSNIAQNGRENCVYILEFEKAFYSVHRDSL